MRRRAAYRCPWCRARSRARGRRSCAPDGTAATGCGHGQRSIPRPRAWRGIGPWRTRRRATARRPASGCAIPYRLRSRTALRRGRSPPASSPARLRPNRRTVARCWSLPWPKSGRKSTRTRARGVPADPWARDRASASTADGRTERRHPLRRSTAPSQCPQMPGMKVRNPRTIATTAMTSKTVSQRGKRTSRR